MDVDETMHDTEDKEVMADASKVLGDYIKQIESNELISRRLKKLGAPDEDAMG